MQIATWILIPILVTHYLMCITPVLPLVLSVPLTAMYLLTTLAGIYYGFVTTKTDSIDHLLYQHLHGAPHPAAPDPHATCTDANETNATNTIGNTKYCWVCQTDVHKLSMHCKYCDKCVENFDHHCMWLNTCIGSSNYKYFIRTVFFALSFVTIHVASILVHISLYFVEHATIRRLSRDWWFGAGANIVLVGINIGFLVFTSCTAFMLLQLYIFHLGLMREKITTYGFIVRDSGRKREKALMSTRVRQRRVDELEKTGNKAEAVCLKAGGYRCFKKCDPVRRLVVQEMEICEANEEAGNGSGVDDEYDDDDEEEERGGLKPGNGATSGATRSALVDSMKSGCNGKKENGDDKDKNGKDNKIVQSDSATLAASVSSDTQRDELL